MNNEKFERHIYLIGLIASAVYVFVIGLLSTRQYLCEAFGPSRCPDTPFTLLHLLMHCGFFGYVFLFLRKIPVTLQWKWYLFCLTVLSFIGIVFVQRYAEVNATLVYLASLLSLVAFVVLFQEKNVQGPSNKKVKIATGVSVLIGLMIFFRNIGVF